MEFPVEFTESENSFEVGFESVERVTDLSREDVEIIVEETIREKIDSGEIGHDVPLATTDVAGIVKVGSNLTIAEDGLLSVDVASEVDEDNTKPITSAAVFTEVGNINVLLSLI